MSCKYCNGDASKDILWADGRGKVSVCDKCVIKAKKDVSDQGEVVTRIVDVEESPNSPTPPPNPIISQFAGQDRAKEEAPTRQEPVLNHELSVESVAKCPHDWSERFTYTGYRKTRPGHVYPKGVPRPEYPAAKCPKCGMVRIEYWPLYYRYIRPRSRPMEDKNRLAPDRGGLRLSLLYDTQHPLNALPPELKRRIELAMTANSTMPSMTNYSNFDAPIPMHPADRPV